MIESMCRHWYAAERRQHEVDYDQLMPLRRDEIRRRVMLVLSGEVRYSECSPGDLRIWHGRARDRQWFDERRQLDRLDNEKLRRGHRIREWGKIWDTLTGPDTHRDWPIQPSTLLFGNANVGNLALTNLQIAGQLASDQTFYVRSWHATMPFDDDLREETRELLRSTFVTFNIGYKPCLQARLVDLVEGCEPADLVVPVRQGISANVQIFGRVVHALNEKLVKRDRERPKWGLAICLEGARTRDVA